MKKNLKYLILIISACALVGLTFIFQAHSNYITELFYETMDPDVYALYPLVYFLYLLIELAIIIINILIFTRKEIKFKINKYLIFNIILSSLSLIILVWFVYNYFNTRFVLASALDIIYVILFIAIIVAFNFLNWKKIILVKRTSDDIKLKAEKLKEKAKKLEEKLKD